MENHQLNIFLFFDFSFFSVIFVGIGQCEQ
jgi:hypothetical protein